MPRPELIYWITAAIIAVSGMFSHGSVDISTHDTYFVIANFHLLLFLAFIYVAFGSIQLAIRLSKRKTSKLLFVIHYVCTTAGILVLAYNLGLSIPEHSGDYSVFSEFDAYSHMEIRNRRITITSLTILIAQIVFVANTVRSLVLKKENQV